MATDLYRRAIAFDHGCAEINDLTRKVWSGTPWMVDVFTGSGGGDRDCEIREWCRDQFGKEAWPIHGNPGRWQRGSATINGWTCFGFDTEAAMLAFMAAWPAPEGR